MAVKRAVGLMTTATLLAVGMASSIAQTHDHGGPIGPSLHVQKRLIDLGRVREGTTSEAEFVLENSGTEDLLITSVETSCGCTTVKLSEEDKVIKPGEQSKLVARFDTTNRLGLQRKSVTLATNDQRHPRITLTLMAEVETLIRVLPQPQLLLRSARRGMALPPLEVYPTEANAKLDKLEVDVRGGFLEYTREEVTNRDGVEGVRLVFSVPAELELGLVNGMVVLSATVQGEQASMPVRVTGQVVGDLVARPAIIQSIDLTPRGRRFAPITVASTNESAFEILGIDAGEFIGVDAQPQKNNKEWRIRTFLKEEVPDGPLATKLVIRTDNSGQPMLYVPMFVNVQSRYRLEPEIVLLGASPERRSRRVRVQSFGPEALQLLEVSCDNPYVSAMVEKSATYSDRVRMVRIELQNGDPPSESFSAQLIVKTSLSGAEELRVPIEYSPAK